MERLKYEGFEENLEVEHYIFRFENGYGASVIRHLGSYGYEDGLFELAVVVFSDDDWHLCYDTEITDNVLGWLTNDDVVELLGKIKALPKKA